MAANKKRERPNVLVFFTDQQRWDTTGLHGNPLDLTPNLDRLAKEHTHVRHCFTPQPLCGPARACMQTGQYATQAGVHRNSLRLKPDAQTLAKCFAGAGYDTAYIGKWHLGPPKQSGPVPVEDRAGYDRWLAANHLEMTSDAYRTRLWDQDDQPHDLPGYRVDALADAVIRTLAEPRDKPFFLFSSFLEPHQQNHIDDYPPPVGYRERYSGRWIPPDLQALGGSTAQHIGGYFGMVKRLDEALGRIYDALLSLKLAKNTILLFTSDHGCHFKTRTLEYKRTPHESSIRVPCVLAGPGFKGGGEVQELVSLIDMPPTLLSACDIPVPKTMSGVPVGEHLSRKPKRKARDDIFIQISESMIGRAVRTRRWKYAVKAPGTKGINPRRESSARYQETYLYDLETDPNELTNLIGLSSHRKVADRMKARLLHYLKEVEGKTPTILNAKAVPSGQRKVEEDAINA